MITSVNQEGTCSIIYFTQLVKWQEKKELVSSNFQTTALSLISLQWLSKKTTRNEGLEERVD